MTDSHAPDHARQGRPNPHPAVMAALGSGTLAITYGLARFVFGLFLPSIRDDLSISSGIAGIIGSLPFLSFVGAILLGPAFGRVLGPRIGDASAVALAAAGLLMIATTPGPFLLAAGVFICGISTGLSSPVMAKAVHDGVRDGLRGRVNAVVNTGTAVGIGLSALAAVVWSDSWRTVYFVFAGLAAVGIVAILARLPAAPRQAPGAATPEKTLTRHQKREIGRLSLLAAGMGTVSAIYWVFAPDAIVNAGGIDGSRTPWVWLAVAVGGLVGTGAGDMVARLGPGRSHAGAVALMAAAVALLAVAPDRFPLVLLTAGLFGAGYMILTGLYLVRSTEIAENAPEKGPVAPLLATSVGQFLGSPIAGWMISATGYGMAFAAFAGLGVVVALASPRLAAPG